ncbi:MAG TPA: cytochrome b/b6 domain-containing protein [bacterium]|nr:cytochrome b/b6 domain-containing protein [bacterium]
MSDAMKRTDTSARALRILWLSAVLILLSFVPSRADDAACRECHGTRDLFEDYGARADSMVVTDAHLGASAHAGLECVNCHADLAGVAEFPHAESLATVHCGSCHEEEASIYQWHGRLKVGVGEDIPACVDCHGTHDILASSDRNSHVNPINLPKTCGRCHENLDLVKKHAIPLERPVELFKSSVHGRASTAGVHLAATCNDCHSTGGTAHRILPPGNVESSINHFNIPKTCGKCHRNVEQDYWEGIHGELTLRGETDSPVCTDCHGEHGILPLRDPRSPVSPNRVAEATCSPCHESARLNEKYGVPTGRLKSFVDSYHGLKSKTGDVTVANCASCHGGHRILPSSDTTSSIHPSNLQKTCGLCHPGISAAAAAVPIHGAPGVSSTPLAGLIKNIYIVIIAVVIGGMALHWLIDLRKQIHLVNLKKQIVRMNYNEVWQHTFLMITFIVLVITGFALRFSESWWAQLLFGREGGFPLRGTIHRVAAVLFILTALWHVGYLLGRRGRAFLVDIMPRKSDFTEFKQMLAYNLGRSAQRPQFGRFSYVEKVEYWALVWGTIIMAITGFFMWEESIAVNLFPKGFLDVMLVIHYYEAWLATLAILIWHMYSTVFNPAVYPMNPAWYTGKMPEDVYRHEHPRDPSLPKASGDEHQHLSSDLPAARDSEAR